MGVPSIQFGNSTRFLARVAIASCCQASATLPSNGMSNVAISEWSGLSGWRISVPDKRRKWGTEGPEHTEASNVSTECEKLKSLAEWGARVLSTADPLEKASLTHHAYLLWHMGKLPVGAAEAPQMPARPSKPELVHPRKVPHAKASLLPPNAHLLHNLAHIELNAIDLAWDTVVRFSGSDYELDEQFFVDFAHVADDESRHLSWCLQRLAELNYSYGDIPAHNLLWKDCQKTSDMVDGRLAVIPMVQEARGLDAGPRLVERLISLDDTRTAGIVKQISEEEMAHVAVGVSWFRKCCSHMGVNPEARFKEMMDRYNVELKGPFNYQARTAVGLPQNWYDKSVQNVDLKCSKPLHEVCDRLAVVISTESENFNGDEKNEDGFSGKVW